MRKVLFIILTTLLLVSLAGCNGRKGFEINEKILDKNVEIKEQPLKPLNTVTSVDVLDYTIVDDSYYKYGFIFVKDELGRFNSLSLFTNKFMFEFADNISLSAISGGFGYYVKVTTTDNNIIIYDAFGKIVLSKAAYSDIQIKGKYISEYNDLGKVIDSEYHEYITYTIEGNVVNKEYIINVTDKSRTEVNKEVETIVVKKPTKIDLKEYGLDGYYLNIIDDTLYVYKTNTKEDKSSLINIINLNDIDIYHIIEGKLFCRKSSLMNETSEDYSYIASGKRYKLSTYTIDLLNGKVEDIETNYQIYTIKPFYDEEGIAKYAYAQIQFINGKSLDSSYSYIILNSKGEIVNQVGVADLGNIVKLSINRYYNGDSYILNSKLEPIIPISKTISRFVYSENLIITALGGNYGAVDYDGNVLIPFEYKELSDRFVNGKTYGINNDGKNYLIDLNNSKTEINKKDQLLSDGILVNFKYDEETTKNTCRIYDYDNNTISSFEFMDMYNNKFVDGFTFFGNYSFAKFVIGPNSYKYIVIDKTMVEVK